MARSETKDAQRENALLSDPPQRLAASGLGLSASQLSPPSARRPLARSSEFRRRQRHGNRAPIFLISDVMTRLSTYMSQARDRELPEEVIEKAKRHVLDTIAAMVSGSELAPGQAAIKFARAYGGKPVATIVGDTRPVRPDRGSSGKRRDGARR